MGAACHKPQDEDDELDPQRRAIKKELKQSKAEELMQIAGSEVVIIGADGAEAAVAQGTLRLLKLAPPSELSVLYVEEHFEDLSAQGFYYPLLQETPVCLAVREVGHVLTMSAGEGDVFGVRLPGPLPEGEERLQALKELLSQNCMLQVLEEPDMADKIVDHLKAGGLRLVTGVESVANYVAKKIAAGGQLAREKVAKAEEEAKVGQATKVSVASARFLSGSVVAVATGVTDGLMETAMMLGQEVTKATKGEGAEEGKEGQVMRVGRAAGGVGLDVLAALVQAGDRILDETCDQTATTVGHRYGQEAGEVAREGLGIARDVKEVKDMVGKKAILRLAAKGAMYTAKGMIDGAPTSEALAAERAMRRAELVAKAKR